MASSVTRLGVSLPSELVTAFDALIERKGYRTRSEAVRDAMRNYLVAQQWESMRGEVIGTVTLVFDHHTRELTHVLTDLQHQLHEQIVCSTHVHLDAHNCLEVIVVRGTADQVRAMADHLISTRGVKHGRLVCTTTGTGLA